jgi:hypothetical protein
VIPADPKQPFDVRAVLARLLDGSRFHEFKAKVRAAQHLLPVWFVLCCAGCGCPWAVAHLLPVWSVPCCAVLCCAVLCCAVLCRAVLCCAANSRGTLAHASCLPFPLLHAGWLSILCCPHCCPAVSCCSALQYGSTLVTGFGSLYGMPVGVVANNGKQQPQQAPRRR